jgi:hypothetical protein
MTAEHFNVREWLEIEWAKIAVRTRSGMLATRVAAKVAKGEAQRPHSVAAMEIHGETEPVEYMSLDAFRLRRGSASADYSRLCGSVNGSPFESNSSTS